MRVLVCGSRSLNNAKAGWRVSNRLRGLPHGTEVIHGAAVKGADKHAAIYAPLLGLAVSAYPADWETHGKRAGIVRNLAMLDTRPDLVLAFWDGESRGTALTIAEARRRGIPVEIHTAAAACRANEDA